jgi:hypothetical protein
VRRARPGNPTSREIPAFHGLQLKLNFKPEEPLADLFPEAYEAGSLKRMTAEELDETAARLEEIGAEEEKLRSALQEQVDSFGFTPPRAEKSKRLTGAEYQFTVSRGVTTEIKDSEVERIRQVCPAELFERLFRTVIKFKLADSATFVLANPLPAHAPRNLRPMFSRAVEIKENGPRLRIERLVAETADCLT